MVTKTPDAVILDQWRAREVDWEQGRCTSPSPNDFIYDAEQVTGLACGQALREQFYYAWEEGLTDLELAHWIVRKLYARNVQLTLDEEL